MKIDEVLNLAKLVNMHQDIQNLGKDKRDNIIYAIPNSNGYYMKSCISPNCKRTFEATIRGQYCNYAPSGLTGSSCRIAVKRFKDKYYADYIVLTSLLLVIIIFLQAGILELE